MKWFLVNLKEMVQEKESESIEAGVVVVQPEKLEEVEGRIKWVKTKILFLKLPSFILF